MRVGLTGGIGSGKSEVGLIFAALGALVIDADALAREALAPGSAGLREVALLWPAVIGRNGELDRAALAGLIFGEPTVRERVNAIVHPIVRALGERLERSAGAGQIVVHEVPLLFETGFWERCDATVVVVAETERRIARVIERSGLERLEVERRMATQIDPREAQRRATFLIRNDGTRGDLQTAAGAVWDALLGLAAGSR